LAWRQTGLGRAPRLFALYPLRLALDLLWSFLYFRFKAPAVGLMN
jgi:tryptophan-rich sensory protein